MQVAIIGVYGYLCKGLRGFLRSFAKAQTHPPPPKKHHHPIYQGIPLMRYKKLSPFLKPQTKFLLGIITIGFLLICLLSFLALSALKYEYDTNFTKHLEEIKILKNIQDFYALESTLKPDEKAITQTLNPQDSKALFHLLHYSYQKLFLPASLTLQEALRLNEKAITQKLTTLLPKLESLRQKHQSQTLTKEESTLLSSHIPTIKRLISQLIDLRLYIASLQNHTINSIYFLTCVVLFSCMLVVLLTTILLSSSVLASIKSHEQSLQETIKEKTLQLENINANLQKTIQSEVESSRKKDQIMYQQDRLASMGEMIQNIAHQWRQPLNSLIILIQSFKTKFYNDKLDENFINNQTEDGLKIAKNMSETIENFRHFFQPNKSKDEFSITEGILDSIKLIEFVLKQNNITIHTQIQKDYSLYGYKNSFTQIILNILKNSQDAIIERGIEQGVCLITLESHPTHLTITLKDNAGGIKEKSLYKIFEPYFTTKHKSVGTGIGLYMTKEIIEKQLQGRISVQNCAWILNSQEFYGAMFEIKIPYPQNQN